MKAKLSITIIIFSVICNSINAQIKLSGTGSVAVGTTTDPITKFDVGGSNMYIRESNGEPQFIAVMYNPFHRRDITKAWGIGSLKSDTVRIGAVSYPAMTWYTAGILNFEVQGNINTTGNVKVGGQVGICGAPYSTYGLTVGNSTNKANSYFYSASILFYGPYSMNLIIDNTSDYGKSVHPEGNNQCNIGNSNKAFLTMWSYAYNKPSDMRQKENVKIIRNALDVVLKLEGVRYDIKKEYAYNDSLIKNKKINAKYEALRKNQIGFIAQDVNKVLPEAVTYDDSTDIYGIDYSKVVPVLVEAIKLQQSQIDSLKKINKKILGTLKSLEIQDGTNNAGDQTERPYLEQNMPNPFSIVTIINFYIPQKSRSASILIFDMQGLQIKAYNITTKGKSGITISGSELQPGMYLYTLIVDGKEIDTKKMILTE